MAGSRTRNEHVYTAVRAAILGGRLRPGQRLMFAEMRHEFNTSASVLRETLTRLSTEGLVRSHLKNGFTVQPICHEDLQNLVRASAEVEALIIHHAVAAGDVDWESGVVAAYHRLARASDCRGERPTRYAPRWSAAHSEFHRSLLVGCANARLLAVGESMRDVTELYWCWAKPVTSAFRQTVDAEHLELRNAVVARDAERASRLLARHIQHALDLELSDVAAPG